MATFGIPHPARYNGTGSFLEWHEIFQLYYTAMEWSNEAQLARLPLFLDGPAYQAFRQLPQEEKGTMAKLTAALQAATEPVKPGVLKQAQAFKMERALHETWESYSYRLTNAVKVAYPEASKETNAKMVATRLFEAFPPEIKTQILMRDLSSLPEILRTAQLMESCSALTADTKPQTGDLAPFTP